MKYLVLSATLLVYFTGFGQHSHNASGHENGSDQLISFDSEKVTKSARIYMNGPINEVFQLFNPIDEQKWEPAFQPKFIYAPNFEIQEGMSFRTGAHGYEPEPIWVITKYDEKSYLIQYLVSTPLRYWTITVQCNKEGQDKSSADITYAFYSLNEEGFELNKHSLHRMYKSDLKDWEEAINTYLAK